MTWEELVAIHAALPQPQPVVCRLYYDENGRPIVYTTDNLEGNYIEVDPETFAITPWNVQVVNNVLKHLPPKLYRNRLIPGNGGTQCHCQDISVIVQAQGKHWTRKTYED